MRRRDRGQATVELALALPVLLVVLLAAIQVGLVARDQVRVAHAAREAARAAALEPTAEVADAAARGASDLDPARLSVAVPSAGAPGDTVTVVVTYRAATNVPVVGSLLADVVLEERATMRVE